MSYKVRMSYFDGQSLDLSVDQDEMKKIIECLDTKKMYWNPQKTESFWTDIKNVRYIQCFSEAQNETLSDYGDVNEKVVGSCGPTEIQTDDGTTTL